MAFGQKDKTKVVMIDGSNLFASAQAIHLDIDYMKLLKVFSIGALRTYYYTALPKESEPSKLRPLIDLLQYNGYTAVTKTMKTYTDPVTGERRIKGNMDIDMCVDAMNLKDYISDFTLFTGDGDFVPLIKELQKTGVHCTVVSTLCKGYPHKHPMIDDGLRKQCDRFVDLEEVRDKIVRE